MQLTPDFARGSRWITAALIAGLVSWGTPAQAERLALVIGNAAYADAALKNPVNDARAVDARLKALHFKTTRIENLRKDQISDTVDYFVNGIHPGDDVVVFYAGHGLQVKGVNYFPAVDARIRHEDDVALNSLNLNALLEHLDEAKARVKLIFLDACRNNPFARAFRGGDRGLARLGDSAASGTLIQYATKPGSVAADGSGSNGLYTSQLLAALESPGEPVEITLKRAAASVKRISHGDQDPWIEGHLDGDFCFDNCRAPAGMASAPSAGLSDAQIEDQYWQAISDSRDRSDVEGYLTQYPKGKYAALARLKLKGMTAATVARVEEQADPAESAFWDEAARGGQWSDYDAYLKAYPNGSHAGVAREALEQMQQIAQQKARRDEDLAWAAAQSGNDWISYSGYLGRYSSGRFATLARFKLSKLPLPPPFRDCAECPEMMMVPAGRFEMGSRDGEPDRSASEGPVHEVTVGQLALGKYAVTQGQWRALMGSNPSHISNCGDNCPVERVNWDDAQAYILKLNERTGKKYRLPSEAEWEYACRAGSHQTYCGSDGIDTVAWYSGNSGSTTHPVGQKQANAWGLYDMSGNVWQWVQDCWHANYGGAPVDARAWEGGGCAQRVLRGGSWVDFPRVVRAAYRGGVSPDFRINYIGFRVARALP